VAVDALLVDSVYYAFTGRAHTDEIIEIPEIGLVTRRLV